MNLRIVLPALLSFCIFSCNETDSSHSAGQNNSEPTQKNSIALDLSQANRLATLPLKCMVTEYPNKTGQVLSTASDMGVPHELHPAFFGCFDWHSSVHGHWSLVKLLKEFPNLDNRDSIISRLRKNISKENIEGEINYFNRKEENSFERMYGWAWLLKLQQELDSWNTNEGKEMSLNLQPLTNLLVERYLAFLPKLLYPLRVGTHTNSAFGMSFAYDYAVFSDNEKLKNSIETTARRLYLNDRGCPIGWEPDGFDFLSPCLEEVTLMQRVLSGTEFLDWMNQFLPQLKNKDFNMEPGKVSDRTDGHLVHLDGLNFSRAWVFYKLAKEFPKSYGHLKKLGDNHLSHSLPSITDGSYEGEHWLGTFALYALSER